MRLLDLMDDLDLCICDNDVFVEVNGVAHAIHEIQDTSQGIIIIVNTDEEDKEMR